MRKVRKSVKLILLRPSEKSIIACCKRYKGSVSRVSVPVVYIAKVKVTVGHNTFRIAFIKYAHFLHLVDFLDIISIYNHLIDPLRFLSLF